MIMEVTIPDRSLMEIQAEKKASHHAKPVISRPDLTEFREIRIDE